MSDEEKRARECAEKAFFRTLLKGGEGNPFRQIAHQWFVEHAWEEIAAYGAECERRGREEALRNLASGMKKVLTAEELKIVKYACSPLEAFLEDLRT